MNQTTPTQSEIDALNTEYKAYISRLQTDWLAQKRVNSNDVYEVMSSKEQSEVHKRIAQWSRYVTPLAESWWKQRGYGVVWPEKNSGPMQVYKLEAEII